MIVSRARARACGGLSAKSVPICACILLIALHSWRGSHFVERVSVGRCFSVFSRLRKCVRRIPNRLLMQNDSTMTNSSKTRMPLSERKRNFFLIRKTIVDENFPPNGNLDSFSRESCHSEDPRGFRITCPKCHRRNSIRINGT